MKKFIPIVDEEYEGDEEVEVSPAAEHGVGEGEAHVSGEVTEPTGSAKYPDCGGPALDGEPLGDDGDEVDVEDAAADPHDYLGDDEHLEPEADPEEEDTDECEGGEAEDGLAGPEHVGEHPRGDLHDTVDDEEGRDEEAHRALVYVEFLDENG